MSSGRIVPAALLSIGAAWLGAGLIMQAGLGPSTAPSPALVAQGGDFYAASCPQCHGDEAQGNEGPSLHRLPLGDAQAAATIKYGIPGKMPAFGKKYDDRQIAALVAYLRTLR